MIDALCNCKDSQKAKFYAGLARDNLGKLIELGFIKEKGQLGLFIAEILLKWVVEEGGRESKVKELKQFIEEATGYEEGRQRKKKILEVMEADRDKVCSLCLWVDLLDWLAQNFARGRLVEACG